MVWTNPRAESPGLSRSDMREKESKGSQQWPSSQAIFVFLFLAVLAVLVDLLVVDFHCYLSVFLGWWTYSRNSLETKLGCSRNCFVFSRHLASRRLFLSFLRSLCLTAGSGIARVFALISSTRKLTCSSKLEFSIWCRTCTQRRLPFPPSLTVAYLQSRRKKACLYFWVFAHF